MDMECVRMRRERDFLKRGWGRGFLRVGVLGICGWGWLAEDREEDDFDFDF